MSKKKKLKNEFQLFKLLKQSKRKELIQIGMWLPKQKSKPSKKIYNRKKNEL